MALRSVEDWIGVVARVRDDAGQLMVGIARDVQGLARTRVLSGIERQVARLGGLMLRPLSAVTQAEVDDLERRVGELEARLGEIARARRARRAGGSRRRSRRAAPEPRRQ